MIDSFKDFVRYVFARKQSVFTCVLGNNETGKTDFNLLLMQTLHDLGIGYRFGSNMRSLKADFPIDFINDFQTLEDTCRMINPDPKAKGLKKYIFFGSEIGKWAPRDQSWKNVEFIEKLQTVRKYGLSMLTDAIDRVDGRVLSKRFFVGVFLKKSKKFATYEDWQTGNIFQIPNIPKTRIDYDTFETANFFMTPQNTEDRMIILNEEHEIVKRYMEFGSWKAANVHPQTGKRAVMKVLDYHMKHCLSDIPEEAVKSDDSATESTD